MVQPEPIAVEHTTGGMETGHGNNGICLKTSVKESISSSCIGCKRRTTSHLTLMETSRLKRICSKDHKNSYQQNMLHRESEMDHIEIISRMNCWHNSKPHGGITLWWNLSVLCLLTLEVGAHDFQLELEASKRLPGLGDQGVFSPRNQYTELPDFEDVNYGDETHFGRKNLHLTAVVGHLFNRSLAEELQRFDPNWQSEGNVIQVHFPSSYIPGSRWLLYRDQSTLLQGVPLVMHEGYHNVYVMVKHAGAASSTTTLPCSIEVLTPQTASDRWQTMRNRPELFEHDRSAVCPQYEPVTAASITITADISTLSESDRVSLVQDLSNFIKVPCKDIALHTTSDSTKNDRPFISGPGNVPKLRTYPRDRQVSNVSSLSWPIGCSSEIIGNIPGLERLENTARDGSLARAIGYDISEWKIVNRVPRVKKLQRAKRETVGSDAVASAMLFYPPASKIPYPMRGISNPRAVPSFETEETIYTPTRGKVRVQVGMVRATPVPSYPQATRVLPDQLVRPTKAMLAATPSITIPPPSTKSPIQERGRNTPMLLFGVENVKARMGSYMEFRIPSDAFFDTVEGSTRELSLRLFDIDTNKQIEEDGDWPLFDSEAQLLYGVPGEDAEEDKEYILVATNSILRSSTVKFSIKVDKSQKSKPASHKFTFYFVDNENLAAMKPGTLYSVFGRKLLVAMAKSEDDPRSLLTMIRTDVAKNKQRYVSWFDISMNRDFVCQSREISDAAKLMAGPDATEGRNKPAKEFAAKFKPEFKLKSIKIDLIGPCITDVSKGEGGRTTTIRIPADLTSTRIEEEGDEETDEPPMIPSPPPQPPVITRPVTMTTKNPTIAVLPDEVTPTPPVIKPPSTNKPPLVGKPLPQIGTRVGSVTEFLLPEGIFMNIGGLESELDMRLVEWGDGMPPWVGLVSLKRTLYLMPTQADFDMLDVYNQTHRVWKGGLVARDNEGGDSPRSQIEVVVGQGMKNVEKRTNHVFHIGIKNYNFKNFTAMDRQRLIGVICEILGDNDANSIYVYPLREGSVLFSWHNSSLAYENPCGYYEIAKLARKLFDGTNKLHAGIRTKFAENNFVINNLNLTRAKWCTEPKSTPTLKPETTKAAEIAAGKSTSILIIAVVVVCLVLLILILVVKCRMGKSAREKERKKREQQKREEAALAVANPDMTTSPRIKKGVPIIFQDEIAMDANGDVKPSPATPLIGFTASSPHYRGNGDTSRSPAVAMDDEDIREETPFTQSPAQHPMTPPTPIMSDRPPPPYATPH